MRFLLCLLLLICGCVAGDLVPATGQRRRSRAPVQTLDAAVAAAAAAADLAEQPPATTAEVIALLPTPLVPSPTRQKLASSSENNIIQELTAAQTHAAANQFFPALPRVTFQGFNANASLHVRNDGDHDTDNCPTDWVPNYFTISKGVATSFVRMFNYPDVEDERKNGAFTRYYWGDIIADRLKSCSHDVTCSGISCTQEDNGGLINDWLKLVCFAFSYNAKPDDYQNWYMCTYFDDDDGYGWTYNVVCSAFPAMASPISSSTATACGAPAVTTYKIWNSRSNCQSTLSTATQTSCDCDPTQTAATWSAAHCSEASATASHTSVICSPGGSASTSMGRATSATPAQTVTSSAYATTTIGGQAAIKITGCGDYTGQCVCKYPALGGQTAAQASAWNCGSYQPAVVTVTSGCTPKFVSQTASSNIWQVTCTVSIKALQYPVYDDNEKPILDNNPPIPYPDLALAEVSGTWTGHPSPVTTVIGKDPLSCLKSDSTMTQSCTLTWNVDVIKTFWPSGAPSADLTNIDLTFALYSFVTNDKASASLTTVPFRRLPRAFNVTVPERDGTAYPGGLLKYFTNPIGSFTFSVTLSTDTVVQSLFAKISCNDLKAGALNFAWPDAADPTKHAAVNVSNVYNVSHPALLSLKNAQCELTITVLNANGGSADSTSHFAIITAIPSVSGPPIDVDPVSRTSATHYQTTLGKAATFFNVFSNTPDYTNILNSYPAGVYHSGIVHIDSWQKLTLSLSGPAANARISAAFYPDLALCTTTSLAATTYVPFSCRVFSSSMSGAATDLNDTSTLVFGLMNDCSTISASLSCVNCFQASRVALCNLQTVLTAYNEAALNTTATSIGVIYDGTAPRILPFTYAKVAVAETYWYSSVQHVDFTTSVYEPDSAIHDVTVSAAISGYEKLIELTIQADFSLQWEDGVAVFNSPAANYIARDGSAKITMAGWQGVSFHGEQYNISLHVSAASGQASTRWELIQIDATSPSIGSVQFTHLVQSAETIQATVRIDGFGDPESGLLAYWGRLSSTADPVKTDPQLDTAWSQLPLSVTAAGPQYLVLDLPPYTGKTSVYYQVAVANTAYTADAPSNSHSLTYATSLPLVLATEGPTVSVTGLTFTSLQSTNANLANGSEVYVSWLANAVVAGIAYVDVTIGTDATLALQTKRIQGNVAKGTMDFSLSQGLAPGQHLIACANVVSNAVPPTSLTNCVTSTNAADATTMPSTARFIRAVVINSLQRYPIGLMITTVDRGGVQIFKAPLTGSYQACVSGFDSFNVTLFAYCSGQYLLDYTPPTNDGVISSLYAGGGFDPNAPVVGLSTNTTAFLARWNAWQDPESSAASVYMNVYDVNTGAVVSDTVVLPGTSTAYLMTGLSLSANSSYAAKVWAINGAGQTSSKMNSAPVKITGIGYSASPVIVLPNGFAPKGNASYTYFPTPANSSAAIHVTWSGFTSTGALPFAVYTIQLLTTGFAPVVTATVANQQDYLIYTSLPPRKYQLKVSLAEVDGTSEVALVDNILILPANSLITTPKTMETYIAAFSGSQSVLLTAAWNAMTYEDPYGLIASQSVAFRRVGDTLQTSGAAVVSPGQNDFNGTVSYQFARPTFLDEFPIECVWTGRDAYGQTYTKAFPGTGPHNGLIGAETAAQPIVLTLSTWSLVVGPTSASDFQFFRDVTVTQNSSFALAFSGFPAVRVQGNTVAQVTYSVGSAASRSGTYDDIVPVTSISLSDASRGLSAYSVLLADGYHQISVFSPYEFQSFPSVLTPVYACVNVTVLSSEATTSACSTQILYDVQPPSSGTVVIDGYTSGSGIVYLTSANSLQLTWSGFVKSSWPDPSSSGIAYFTWRLGSYPGGSDFYPATAVDGSQLSALVSGMTLASGSNVYATVTAFDYHGLSASATSVPISVALQPPASNLGITALSASSNAYGTYDVTLTFDPFVDYSSGLRSTVWVIESAYGLEDVLSSTFTDTSSSASATSLALKPGQTYQCRVTATSNAGLQSVLLGKITPDKPIVIQYLIDGLDPKNQFLYVTSLNTYSFSWEITGSVSSLSVAVGTEPGLQDVQGWTSVSSASTSFSLSVLSEITEGFCLYGSLFAQDSGSSTKLVQSTGGTCIDTSPPISGTVVYGRCPHVHQRWTADTNLLTASWRDFSDSVSGIAQYLWCIDSGPSTTSNCSVVDWTDAAVDSEVLAVPLSGGALADGRTYFVKVKAVNGAGLATVTSSPPWTVDKSPATGGTVSTSFPSVDAAALALSPSWNAGGDAIVHQLHLDNSVVKVDWSGFADNQSGVASYEVGLFGTVGEVTPFADNSVIVPGATTQWTFAGLRLNSSEGSNNAYYAVVTATNGAGLRSQMTSPSFCVLVDPPQTGSVQITSISSDGTALNLFISGFLDANVNLASYHILVGVTPFGSDLVQRTIEPAKFCQGNPCTPTLSVPTPLALNGIYFVTVYAENVGGLVSAPATSAGKPFWGGKTGLIQSSGFQWNISCQFPALSFDQPTVNLKGYGLANFFTAENQPTSFNCIFAAGTKSANTTGMLTATKLTENAPVLGCPLPASIHSVVADGDFFSVSIGAPDGTASLPLRLQRRESAENWASSFQSGLATVTGSVARLSNALHAVSWTASTPNIAFFELYVGTTLLAKFPAYARSGLATTRSGDLGSSFQYRLCASFNGESPALSCATGPRLSVNIQPPALAPGIDSGDETVLQTAVRLNPIFQDSAQFVAASGTAFVDWTGSFVGAGQKAIASYTVFLSFSPRLLTPGLPSVTLPGNVTSVSLAINQELEEGATYYANIIARDDTGLQMISWSPPFISDITPPISGSVHFGRPSMEHDTAFQSHAEYALAYWSGFSDPESGLSRFEARICSDVLPCAASLDVAGASVANLSLPAGKVFWANVRAQNGAGIWTPWISSKKSMQVEQAVPQFSYAFFAGNKSGVAPVPFGEVNLVWSASGLAPIVEYKVQLGTTPGGPQLMPLTSVGTFESLALTNLKFAHNTSIFATIVAMSASGLQNGIQTAGMFIDLTPPDIVGQITSMGGASYIQTNGSTLNITADWTGAFADAESHVESYEWAIGTAGSPAALSNMSFQSTGLLTQGWRSVKVAEGTLITVTVQARNGARLVSTLTSAATLVADAQPSDFSVTLQNGQALVPGTLAYAPGATQVVFSSIARFSFDGLADNESGLKDVRVMVNATDSNEVLWDASIGVMTGIDLEAENAWLMRPLVVKATAFNHLGLSKESWSSVFAMISVTAI
ncbi:hypothetical protein HDU88_002539 [Geranomyces variabilis]|nr:hypothetical protein HDU88_002539 [Geranomyces variabilis]